MVIAVDFDGTLYLRANNFPNISGGSWNTPLINAIEQLQECSPHIEWVLWTCREGEELELAVNALMAFNIKWHAVNDNAPCIKRMMRCNPRKIIADLYVDNAAVPLRDAVTTLKNLTLV